MVNIVYATSEAVPFIKTGGLADVVGSMPRYLSKKKYKAFVFLPKYQCMDEKYKKNLKFVCSFYMDLAWRKQYVGVLESTYEGIKYYFIDNEYYFSGDKPYNMIHEDVEKFSFFSKAILEALFYLNLKPDIIHCNDWQTGLIPVFLKELYKENKFYQNIKTIFTIHNLNFQGRWNIQAIQDATGLPEYVFTDKGIEAYGEANYLKGGLVYSDYVTTVSPSYARDICTPEGGVGLDGVLRSKGNHVLGIINGIDYKIYNPERDKRIAANFDKKDLTGKKKNKKELQKMLNLPEKKETFVVAMVSRMTDQKGFDLVNYVLESLVNDLDIQFVFLGTGENYYENSLKYFHNKYPNKVSAYIGYNEQIAHKFYSGADAFLMPSLFEPCGLSQLMAMRYGTVPIVRETGGLIDTVEPYNEYENTGTGFTFANYNGEELADAIRYAYDVYNNHKKMWSNIVKRDMESDFSWKASARMYEKLYESLV
ncbi:glycogen synthase GlgA [Lachnobacterium bovis]|uniref:Glycogen synthase n=1 Tax=Lachnobacterium bovis TaxID=140626 RepID=A0A1H9PUB5_9FIRM|nr:glycogen synthase GlgA [Lachnobacterium bovis]SER51817.1 starch synthase [Lachnobacterium bovis]